MRREDDLQSLDLQREGSKLSEALKTCHKMVTNYRAVLTGAEPADARREEPPKPDR